MPIGSNDVTIEDRIERAFEIAFSRKPSERETLQFARELVSDADAVKTIGLSSAHGLIASNEFLYVH